MIVLLRFKFKIKVKSQVKFAVPTVCEIIHVLQLFKFQNFKIVLRYDGGFGIT